MSAVHYPAITEEALEGIGDIAGLVESPTLSTLHAAWAMSVDFGKRYTQAGDRSHLAHTGQTRAAEMHGNTLKPA